MSRYLKKFKRIGQALGPSEERGFALWVGYDLPGLDGEIDGLVNVDGWPAAELARYGVHGFVRVEPDDYQTYEKLGIARRT